MMLKLAHASSWRRVLPAMNATTAWVLPGLVVLGEVLGCVFLHAAADLSDENDTFGLLVFEKELDEVESGGTGKGSPPIPTQRL